MRLLKRPAVMDRAGIASKSALYQKMKDGEFPRPVKTSSKAVAWVEGEVDQWIADRVAARDAPRPKATRVRRAARQAEASDR